MSRTTELANKLSKRAADFDYAANAILIITLIGAVIVIIVGLVPTCTFGGYDCDDSAKVAPLGLSVAGATAALIAWWLYAFSAVVATRAQLAAEIAAPAAGEAPTAE
jgi:hypothetical protein